VQPIRASSKGQIVIPKTIREALKISAGTELDVELLPGEGFRVLLRRKSARAQSRALAGSLGRYLTPGSRAISDAQAVALAVRDEAAESRPLQRRKRVRRQEQ
jgi:AbrB family looped-hinge helix DNA binding protein